jgi:hypothetical protein
MVKSGATQNISKPYSKNITDIIPFQHFTFHTKIHLNFDFKNRNAWNILIWWQKIIHKNISNSLMESLGLHKLDVMTSLD